MGQGNSIVQLPIFQELLIRFIKLESSQSNVKSLLELQSLELPQSVAAWLPAKWTSHIGLLYCLDSDRDGLVSKTDFAKFCQFVYLEIRQLRHKTIVSDSQIQQHIQGKCTIEFVQSIESNRIRVEEWIIRLIRPGMVRLPSETAVSDITLQCMYILFEVKSELSDWREFKNFLQQQNASSSMHEFITAYLETYRTLMHQMSGVIKRESSS